jgi:hypothetical protein
MSKYTRPALFDGKVCLMSMSGLSKSIRVTVNARDIIKVQLRIEYPRLQSTCLGSLRLMYLIRKHKSPMPSLL